MWYTKELYVLLLLLQSCYAQKNSKANGKDGKKEKKNDKMILNFSQVKSTTFISYHIPTHRPSVVPSIKTLPSRFPSINPSNFPSNPPTVVPGNGALTTSAASMKPTISPSKTQSIALKSSDPILQPTISSSKIPTITPKDSKPLSVGPSMALASTERSQVPSNQSFPSESSASAQTVSLTSSEIRSAPIPHQVPKVKESQLSSTEKTSSASTVVYQPSTTARIVSPAVSTQSSILKMKPSAASRQVLPRGNTRPVVARVPSIKSPSKKIRSPLKKSIIPPEFLVESTSSTIHQLSKSPSVSPSPSLMIYTSSYLGPKPSSPSSNTTTLHLSSSTHHSEHRPTVSSLLPKPSPNASPSPTSSMSPSPSSRMSPSPSLSMSPSPSSSMSPSPSSSMSPSPSSSMSPSPSTLPIHIKNVSKKTTTKFNYETTNINQYIIINLYLTSMTEEQRREELHQRWTRVERYSSQDKNYCPSKYREMTGYITAANIRAHSTFDSIVAVIANIIAEATNHQVEGVNILRSDSNTSNKDIGYSRRRTLLPQFLTLDLSNPLLIIEDRDCWVHMRVPLSFTLTNDTLSNNSTSSKNGGRFSNQTSTIPYGFMQHIRLNALRAIEKSALDGSFIERLHLNELVIRNVSFDVRYASRYVNSEHQSKSSTVFWEPIRMTGIALFLSTFSLTVILTTVARKRSQLEDSQRISSPPHIIECQS
jgi:hypothetical protein